VRAPLGVNDGKGVVFISHKGDVQPSGFLALIGGNVRGGSLAEIYRHSALFVQVRDYSQLKGKCGTCEFKEVCGGSRARAYAMTGDPMRSDPYCMYRPGSWKSRARSGGQSGTLEDANLR
jgi:radical SAM protein with 4Fe4S-binding SPASM domain